MVTICLFPDNVQILANAFGVLAGALILWLARTLWFPVHITHVTRLELPQKPYPGTVCKCLLALVLDISFLNGVTRIGL